MSFGKLSAFALFLILSPSLSWAQGARNKEVTITPSAESQAALVRHSFETELQSILEKYLKPHQYAIDVQFKVPANLKGVGDVPYAPDSIIPDSFQGLPSAEQLKKLQDLQVRVMVPQWMDGQTKSTLQNLLSKRLEQLMGSSVRLELESVPLNVEEPPKAVPGMPGTPASPVSSSPPKEVEELKAQMQKDREQYKEDLKDLQDKLNSADKVNPITGVAPSASKNAFQDFWEFCKSNPIGAGVVVLLVYAAVFTLAFLPSRSLSSGLGNFRGAYDGIAKSIKSMADAMARSGSGGGGNSSESEKPSSPTALATAPGGAAVATHGKSQPSYPELRALLQDIQKLHKAASDPIVLEMIQSFLAQPGQALKAVLVLELLGPQHGNRIFDQLAPDQKDIMLRQVDRVEGSMSDKTEALYELAEAYQTRLLATSWKGGTRSALDEVLQRNIGGLQPNELATVARQLKTEEGLRRFLLYLDAPSLVQLIQSFKRNPQEKELVLKSLAAMPEALDADHADPEIQGVVEQYLIRKRQDRYLPYMAHFEAIVAQSGEDMEDDLIEQIARSNPSVGRHLRQKIVTIGSFFAQSEAVRRELLGPFSNYELAVLVSSFADDQKKAAVLSAVEGGRRELVQEQLHMLVDENKYALADSQRSMKARLKDGLRQARANHHEEAEEVPAEVESTRSNVAA